MWSPFCKGSWERWKRGGKRETRQLSWEWVVNNPPCHGECPVMSECPVEATAVSRRHTRRSSVASLRRVSSTSSFVSLSPSADVINHNGDKCIYSVFNYYTLKANLGLNVYLLYGKNPHFDCNYFIDLIMWNNKIYQKHTN